MFYEQSLNQKFTKNTIMPNYPFLKDDKGDDAILYNVSLVHAGMLYRYNYSFLEAIMGSYDRGVGTRNFAFAQAATNDVTADNLATKYVIRFSSVADIVMGNLVDFGGEDLKVSDFEFAIDGIVQSNIRKSGLETFIANQASSIMSGESEVYNNIFSTDNFITNF
jgi:hypothetical protein